MLIPRPATFVADLPPQRSASGFSAGVSDPGLGPDVEAAERALSGYVSFVAEAVGELTDTLASCRTAVSLHMPVDLPHLIDGLRSARESCGRALEAIRDTVDPAGTPSVNGGPSGKADLLGWRRQAERAVSRLLHTYDDVLSDLRELHSIVTAPDYAAAFAQDVGILERVLESNWPGGISVARTELSLVDASATLDVILSVPRSLYADVPRTVDLVTRTLRDADEAGCRLVGHLIIDLVPIDAS